MTPSSPPPPKKTTTTTITTTTTTSQIVRVTLIENFPTHFVSAFFQTLTPFRFCILSGFLGFCIIIIANPHIEQLTIYPADAQPGDYISISWKHHILKWGDQPLKQLQANWDHKSITEEFTLCVKYAYHVIKWTYFKTQSQKTLQYFHLVQETMCLFDLMTCLGCSLVL